MIFISAIWIIGVLIYINPWYRSGTTRSGLGGVRRYSYSNWDDFFLIGVLPVIVLWGMIWIGRGFRATRNKST